MSQAAQRVWCLSLRSARAHRTCGRRMGSHWVNGLPYYRCRFPAEYALANRIEHPLNVSLW